MEKLVELFWALLIFLASKISLRRRKKCLLVIDDNEDDSEILTLLLNRQGYVTTIVTTAEAAQALVRYVYYPIIFIDARLPMISGVEFIESIRNTAVKSHLVLVCGLSEDLREIPISRYVGVIIKPVTLESVEDCIKKTRM